jgi:integrase
VPTREIVAQLTGPQHKDTYSDRLCRHVAHFLAHTGRRISKARDLRISDVNWEANELHLWSEKQDDYRLMRYSPFIVTAPNGPNLKHYVEHVRPEPADGHEDVLFLRTDGCQWSYGALHNKLNAWGKEGWPGFYSHSLRKFAATTMLVENDYDLTRTAIRLGIQAQSVEEHYLDQAVIRNEMGTDFTMPRTRGEEGGMR